MHHIDSKVYNEYKPLGGYKKRWAWAYVLPRRDCAGALAGVLSAAWKNFFIMQLKRKIGITKTPIVKVDNTLDDTIPFTKTAVKIYTDFVSFFIRSVSLVTKEVHGKRRRECVRDFLLLIKNLYEMAATIYREVLSTTERGHYKGNFRFLIIHMFDPHYLCVPSLHVAIVTGCYLFLSNLVKTGEIEDEDGSIIAQVRAGAVKITESVLFVKQHSVNCVAASLYMMSDTKVAGEFSTHDVATFIDDLFLIGCGELKDEEKECVREYIFEMFKKFRTMGKRSAMWQLPLLVFLHECGVK